VHVPFCVHKCGYCDFNSWAEEGLAPQEKWFEAIRAQMTYWADSVPDTGIGYLSTIFFGGGTPSLLDDKILAKTLRHLRESFTFSENYEWTLECNPETLTPEKLAVMADHGVNRISLGIQSFNNKHLARLERRARKENNLHALALIAKHWKGRWSADLMFGLPEQSLAQSKEDLQIALDHGMKHLSAYQLTLTTQRSKAWQQPPEDELLEMFDQTEEMLAEYGLHRYEVSNFAAPGQECRHNLRYWELGSFIGIGPGAAGLLPPSWGLGGSALSQGSGSANAFGFHQRQPENFEKWRQSALSLAKNPGLGTLTPRSVLEHFEEMLMMGLRLKKGISAQRFAGLPIKIEDFFAPYISKGLVEKTEESYRVSPRGLRILDSLLLDLFADLKKSDLQNLDPERIDPTFR